MGNMTRLSVTTRNSAAGGWIASSANQKPATARTKPRPNRRGFSYYSPCPSPENKLQQGRRRAFFTHIPPAQTLADLHRDQVQPLADGLSLSVSDQGSASASPGNRVPLKAGKTRRLTSLLVIGQSPTTGFVARDRALSKHVRHCPCVVADTTYVIQQTGLGLRSPEYYRALAGGEQVAVRQGRIRQVLV